MPGINEYADSLQRASGQKFDSSKNNIGSMKNAYPAIVVDADDPTEQGRIKARIVSLSESGEIIGGRDRNVPDISLQWAVPLKTGFLWSMPKLGEMVILLMENPSEITAPRYWIGPIITSQLKLNFQGYREASKVYARTDFNPNKLLLSRSEPSIELPNKNDVALQGRDDTHVILKPREILIATGFYRQGELKANTESPSHLRLKQINNSDEAEIKSYSQANLQSTVVNIFSPRGKYREEELAKFEINQDLKDLGDLANRLHPAVFGDELVKLLDLIIKILLNHIHTPQNPLVTNPDSRQLSSYTVDGELQKLLSKHIRIN